MYKMLITGAACAILLAAPAAAMTPNTANVSHTNVATSPSTSGNKTATHYGHRNRLARNSSTRGDREVHALNALEAAGYRQFTDVHARGANFVATAQKAGKSYDVTVMPSGNIRATNA